MNFLKSTPPHSACKFDFLRFSARKSYMPQVYHILPEKASAALYFRVCNLNHAILQ